MKMKKAVIFDLDGTLVNSIYDLAYSCNYALEKVGQPPYDLDKYRYFVGNGIPVLIERVVNGINRPDLYDEVFKIFNDYYAEHYVDKTKAYDGIFDLLNFLKEKGLKIAILSNKAHRFSVEVAEKIFGKDYFDIVFGLRDGVPAKPAPDAVFEIMEKLNVAKEDCLYVGDTGADMQTGNNAGVKTIGVLWGFREKEELVENNAKVIVSHPSEIKELI